MSLVKKQTIDKVEIVGDFKTIQARTKVAILENDIEITSSFHREVFDIFNYASILDLPEQIQPYAQGVWTDELYALCEEEKQRRHEEWLSTQEPAS